jgi:hypothetical protein
MTESGHAASFGIDIIIMASAGGVELAVGAAAVERHDGVCAEAGVIPQQGALAYGSCTQPGVQRMLWRAVPFACASCARCAWDVLCCSGVGGGSSDVDDVADVLRMFDGAVVGAYVLGSRR